jgi:hypothetical protein
MTMRVVNKDEGAVEAMSSEPGGRSESVRSSAAAKVKPLRIGTFSRDNAQACMRVRALTRARFDLAGDAAVLVSELACTRPGCPPLETVVAFWTEGGTRHDFKLFKPVAEVVMDDLPPAWLEDALFASEATDTECC